MRLNLLYQFNEKYAPYAGVSITSVLMNNREIEEICIYILGEGLAEESEKRLENLAREYRRNLIFIDTDQLVDKMKALDMPTYRGSYAANMRLFLDEVLDSSVDKVLYLDADTVVDTSLEALLRMDMHGKSIGMVLDSLGESHKEQIGLSKKDEYFNSGVILFDLKRWREKRYSEKIAGHVAEERNNYPAPDQDLLNIVCKGDILRLDIKYNFQPVHTAFSDRQYYHIMKPVVYYSEEEIKRDRQQVSVFHCFRFLGEFPWNRGNLHPYNEVFDRYLLSSPWKEYQKEKAAIGLTIKIEKVLYRILPKCLFLPVFKVAHAMFLYQSNKDALNNKTNKLM